MKIAWQRFRLAAILVAALFVLFCLVFLRLQTGVHVRIHNDSANTVSDVSARIGDSSVSLKSLKPGQYFVGTVYPPNRESSMTISFRNDTGEVKALDNVGYYERGYTGTVEASVGPGVKVVEQRTELSFRLYLSFLGTEINIFPPFDH